jgi:hypothetical protein
MALEKIQMEKKDEKPRRREPTPMSLVFLKIHPSSRTAPLLL